MTDAPKKKQGFACLSPERRREVAAMGGKAVPAAKRAYSRDNALARASGLKGGIAPHVSRGGIPDKQIPQEVWKGSFLAKLQRMALANKTLVEAREAVGSQLKIPAFRSKCLLYGIRFIRTRPE